ncbi:MAG TPA: hypothetical protein VNU44_19860 [Bryobacteraceae bacterium]|jgi:hypothetical protein|nr:hypothetical protein [Bryobacteraceae bacterium]
MGEENDIRAIVQSVMQEFLGSQGELAEERKRRESLEQRVNELVTENQKARTEAEAADRSSAIKAELQKLGVAKVDLAYRAVKDDVYRSEDGRLMGQGGADIREYLTTFVNENPELLPARMSGGSGASAGQRGISGGGVDIDTIRPGMSAEEKERVRQEIARVASQTLRGL